MKSILEELYFGNIDPNATFIRYGGDYTKAMNTLVTNEDKLMGVLDDGPKQLFREFSDAHAAVNSMTAIDKFTFGFKLGALLMIEVLADASSLLRE